MARDWTLTLLAWAAPYLVAALIAAATWVVAGGLARAKHVAGAVGRRPILARRDAALGAAGDDPRGG